MGNERKETTHEIIFPESYPRGVPQCQHGPALRLKSIKRGVKGKPVEESEKWVCSFDRNGPCHFEKMETTKKKILKQTKTLKPDWIEHFVTNTNDKTQGQYFFSDETIKLILANVKSTSSVLLVGCPSLVVPLVNKGHKVKLLDIDQRFLSIFPPNMFSLFNMMNGHFFTEIDEFDSFLQKVDKKLVIIADPPFGVQIDVLMRTLKMLGSKCNKPVQYLTFFPWFHHKRFASYDLFPSDYRVTYASHSKMNRNKTVRIFSNKLKRFRLPLDEYKNCDKCKKYVHKTQFHCKLCNQCADISGRRVKHCDHCNACTVAHQPHCVACGKCQPKEHVCRVPVKSECFLCGQVGHKQSDCKMKKK